MNQQVRNRSHRSGRLTKVGGAWLASAMLLGLAAGPAVAAPRAEDPNSAAEELQAAASRSLATDFAVTRTLSYHGSTTTLSTTAYDAQTRVEWIDNHNSASMVTTVHGDETFAVKESVWQEYLVRFPNSTVVCDYSGSDAEERKLMKKLGIRGVKFTKSCLDFASKAESDRSAVREAGEYLFLVDSWYRLSKIATGDYFADMDEPVIKETLPDGSSQFKYGPADNTPITVGANGLVSSLMSDESGYFGAGTTQTDSYTYGTDFNITAPTEGLVSGKRARNLSDLVVTHFQVNDALTRQVQAANLAGNSSLTQLRTQVRKWLTTTRLKTSVTVSGQKLVVSFRDKFVNRTHTYKVIRKGGQLRYGA